MLLTSESNLMAHHISYLTKAAVPLLLYTAAVSRTAPRLNESNHLCYYYKLVFLCSCLHAASSKLRLCEEEPTAALVRSLMIDHIRLAGCPNEPSNLATNEDWHTAAKQLRTERS